MNAPRDEVELRVRGDRAVLRWPTRPDSETDTGAGAEADTGEDAEADAESGFGREWWAADVPELGADLAEALDEWARVTAALARAPGDAGAELVSRRGRQLAGRAATMLRRPVRYHDPVRGVSVLVGAHPPGERSAAGETPIARSAPATRTPSRRNFAPHAVGVEDGATAHRTEDPRTGVRTGAHRVAAARPPGAQAAGAGRTPWGTGLTVAVFAAVVTVVAMLALARALTVETTGWVAVLAAAVVTAGVAPSLWLGRRVPVMRWIVLGATSGVILSWVGVLAIALG